MFKDSGVVQRNPIRNVLSVYLLRRFSIMRKLPSILFYPKPILKGENDKIIVFDTYASSRLITWLSETQREKRIILWYWNSLKNRALKSSIPPRVETWSFSKSDCAEFGLKYNTQFFFDSSSDSHNLLLSYKEEAFPSKKKLCQQMASESPISLPPLPFQELS